MKKKKRVNLIMTNGIDKPNKWRGGGEIKNAPIPKYIKQFKKRMEEIQDLPMPKEIRRKR